MSCCGGGRPRNVRHQAITQSATKQSASPVVQRRVSSRRSSNSGSNSEIRQYIVSSQQCVKCGYPIMLVKISGRERSKCSNVNCGELL